MSEMTIALLGQPNSGKSTLFNGLTGSRQHVGNWPGKTVEQKEGYFSYEGIDYTVVDLPGTYSLSANSEEEIVTRQYILSDQADVVFILADASQLERSLFMLADYVGIKTPVVLLLNMMDVAAQQGKDIDSTSLSKKLGIPVVPIIAADSKCYGDFYKTLKKMGNMPSVLKEKELFDSYKTIGEGIYQQVYNFLPKEGIGAYSSQWLAAKLLEQDDVATKLVFNTVSEDTKDKLVILLAKVQNGSLLTGDCKFNWIEGLLKDSMTISKKGMPDRNRFDRMATSRTWGKPLAIAIIILGVVLSIAIAMPFMGLFGYLQGILAPLIAKGLFTVGLPDFVISLVCDGVLTAVTFALMMVSFVFGISLVFGFLEEIGYMARVSYIFDDTMSKLGLQGKAIMPFLISFGCNIGGVAGTRVIDSWGQRVTTMALSWVIPCAATWGVLGLISSVFFGSRAIFVIISLFIVALLHINITSKVFGRSLIKESDKCGLIMELPPYHKPKYKNLLRFVFNRMGDVLIRALKVIVLVSVLFWALSYTKDGNVENSIIYTIGTFIEPVTMWFGLRWQTFMAFIASAMGKEAALGVLASLFNTTSGASGVWGAIAGEVSINTSSLGGALMSNISKAEALAFIYAFFFNVPCLMTVASTQQESHSIKWTIRIVGYYIVMALLMSTLAYHVGNLIF